jgi:hypothetical protein
MPSHLRQLAIAAAYLQEFVEGTVFAAGYALLMAWPAWKARREDRRLPLLSVSSKPCGEDHIALIPARNDASTIAAAVASFPASLVCVIDAGSTDHTAEVAASAGATVVRAGPPPVGWTALNHAAWVGAQQSESKWILLVDAQASFAPGFVQSVLNYAVAHQLRAVAVIPRHIRSSALAGLVLDGANALGAWGIRARQTVPQHADEMLLAGGCLLLQRTAYDFIRGHAVVRGSSAADYSLALLLRRHAFAFHIVHAEALAQLRDRGFASALHTFMWRFMRLTRGAKHRAFSFAAVFALAPAILCLMAAHRDWAGAAGLWLAGALCCARFSGGFRRALLVFPLLGFAALAMVASGFVHYFGMPEYLRGPDAAK